MATIIFVFGVLWRKLGRGARQEFLCCTILFRVTIGFLRYFQLKQLPNFLLAFPILSLAVCSIIYYVKLRREVFLSLGFRASPVDKKSAAMFFSVGTESRSKSESVNYTLTKLFISLSSWVVGWSAGRRPHQPPRPPLSSREVTNEGQSVAVASSQLEFKDFRFQVAEDGKSISITKITRGGSYRINIDFKVADWVSRELKKAVNSMGERWFVSKYQSSTALMLLQKYCNDRGVFISLMELRRGTVCRVIVFPACKNGEGWVKAANALWEVVNGRVYFQTIREETWAIRERRYMPNDQTKSQIHSQSENQIGWGKVNLESKEDLEDDRLKGNEVQEDEIVKGYEEEDLQRIGRNAKGWNRMRKNNLIKMKWTSKKSIQFYSRRNKKRKKVALRFGEEQEIINEDED
ncbi:hypothetical protein LguiA_007691 [Lonicera macranthoides]